MIKIPIRITVMGLFLLIASTIMAIMFYIQMHFSEDLAKDAMQEQFKITSYKVEDNIKRINNISNSIITSTIPFIKDIKPNAFFKNKNKYLEIFSQILKNNQNLYSVYIGFNDNRFYEIINLKNNKELHEYYNVKKEATWLLVEINKNKEETLSFYTNKLTLISSKTKTSAFNVKQRPWYKKSLQSNEITKVGPYNFANIKSSGITYSKQINDNNIFAIDILLNNFSNILKNNNSLESYLFNENKNIIAKSTNNDLIFNQLIKLINIKELDKTHQNIVSINGISYIFDITQIKGYDKKEYLLSYALLDDMMNTYIDKFSDVYKIFIILFLVFIPIIWYFASIIVKPILLLVKESEKVRNREFNKILPVNSIVNEVNLLSNSIKIMANSIHEYQSELEQKVIIRTEELELKNKELEILSITDKLTNTYNRIKLDNTIEERMLESNNNSSTFSVIIIDIDFFKQVNDTYGHQVGDVTLVEFTKILKENLESEHILGRWGGEEFIIVSSFKNLQEVIDLSNTLREKIQNHKFPTIGTKTASFGVSMYRKDETSEELINRADEALYIAKKNGRNRVETIEEI